MALSDSQLQAVTHPEGPCMVLAGPGSGKTTVITERLNYLVGSGGVQPENILVVTFTNAAAAEMKQRYLDLRKEEKTDIGFGTFHSVFYRILRDSYSLRTDQLLTENERLRLLKEVFRQNFPSVEADTGYLQDVLGKLSVLYNRNGNTDEKLPGQDQVSFKEVMKLFEKKKEEGEKIDFDDMLIRTRDMLKKRPDILKKWQEKFRWILVDEFQDINPVQYEVLKLIALPENNLFIVGDDDQSIYAFRAASPEIMLNFPKDFAGCRTLILDRNFRSRPEIVKASLRLIGHNKARYPKKLRAAKEKGGAVTVRDFRNENEEGEALSQEILSLQKAGIPLHEIAVLTRTNSGASSVISALTRFRLPYISREQFQNPYTHFILKPVFAVFNWIQGNHTRENFLKFMNCPNRYFRRDDLKSRETDLEELEKNFRSDEDRAYMADRCAFLSYQLELLKSLVIPFSMINFIRKYMEYDRYVEAYAAEKKTDPGVLLKVLDEIQEDAASFGTLDEWYTHIAKVSGDMKESRPISKDRLRDRVMLSTLHASKGLEYTAVFIMDVNENVIPHERSVTGAGLEEERRMLYVGMTRASERLYLYHVHERFGKKVIPSRFLKEI